MVVVVAIVPIINTVTPTILNVMHHVVIVGDRVPTHVLEVGLVENVVIVQDYVEQMLVLMIATADAKILLVLENVIVHVQA